MDVVDVENTEMADKMIYKSIHSIISQSRSKIQIQID